MKRSLGITYKYGQQAYDFEAGVMFFLAPNQVLGIEYGDQAVPPSGWILLIHPDFLWNTPLAKIIHKYEYFNYSVNEALFLSGKEEAVVHRIIQSIQHEYHSPIDPYSQEVMLTQVHLLLTYAERFYNRQFITRKISNHQILIRLDGLLTEYFTRDASHRNGLPTVQFVSEQLNLSVSYLSRVLRVLTGQSTQQHLHDKLLEVAKERLSTTDLSISEIAYGLGFEHPQSFSKLFKTKTQLSPVAFRQSFA